MRLGSEVGARVDVGAGIGKRRTTNAYDAVGSINKPFLQSSLELQVLLISELSPPPPTSR